MGDNLILDCCLDMMRRLPPRNVEANLSALIDLAPESLLEDLLSTVDQPLKVSQCKESRRQYLICDYNRDGDSYRSPWSNSYDPHLSDGAKPSDELRKLEVKANLAFDQYREMYFEGGISSVYLWDLDSGFAGAILIKKAGEGSAKVKGFWDSIHIFEVTTKGSGKTANSKYKLTSTVMLWLQTQKDSGTLNLGGSVTRQQEKSFPLPNYEAHICNMGQMVEDMENTLRQNMSNIYFSKTKDIVCNLRSMQGAAEEANLKRLQDDLANKLKSRNQ